MDWKTQKVLVAGSGKSGIGATDLLKKVGAEVIIYDGNDKLKEEDVLNKLENKEDVKVILGELEDSVINEIDMIVLSPEIAIDAPFVLRVKEAGVPIWGEIELAYVIGKGKLAAITGTNGKTTTTALVGEIMANYYDKVDVVGNIGNPYTTTAFDSTDDTVTVAEISSFQLETIHTFKPDVSAVLNITPDHLNRHHTMECYEQTKEMIAANQTKQDTCVLNYDDERLREFGENKCKASVVWFSSNGKVPVGAYVDGDMIKYTDGTSTQDIINVHDMNLLGKHNYENVCAAVAISKAAGVPDDIIVNQVRVFKAVEHRIEYVATKNDVMYYNDSKGTNPEAAVKAIEAMQRPTILIGGGYDKGSEFDLYVKAFKDKVKLLVLIGQTSEKIAATAKKYGFDSIIYADSMEEVVKICAQNAKPGDAVLLSPACASWGMFDNYEQRGRMFKDYVNAL